MSEVIFADLASVVAQRLNVTIDRVSVDANLFKDLEADSLDVVEIVLALEQAYDIKVADDLLDDLRTVADLFEVVIAAKLSAAQS